MSAIVLSIGIIQVLTAVVNADGCSNGYYEQIGDLPGWTRVDGMGGGDDVQSCDECAAMCSSTSNCQSYECSHSALRCNLNSAADPSQYFDTGYGDYDFCTKEASPWILAASDVCFSARSFVSDSTFTAPESGDVVAVKLVHTSGGVACSTAYDTTLTNWGCHAQNSGDTLRVQLVHHNDDLTVDTVLPTTSTVDVTSLTGISCSAGCSVNHYMMDGVDVSAAEMTWEDPLAMLSVTTEDTFSLQYGEGCCGSSTSDNDGTSCADVYFKYRSSGSYRHIGCFADDGSRTLDHYVSGGDITIDECHAACPEYKYFALQHGQGTDKGECRCGNSLDEATQLGVSDACAYSTTGTGWSWANDLYENLDLYVPTASPSVDPTAAPSGEPSPSPSVEPATAEPVTSKYSDRIANAQCHTDEVEYDGDRLDNPIFEGGGYIGTMTLSECQAACDSRTDSNGRPCVAIEWSDGGNEQSDSTAKSCALAWACDWTESWSGGSVFMREDVMPVMTGVVLVPGDYDVDGIDVQFGDQCDVSDSEWYLHADTTGLIEDWAIELDLQGIWALSAGYSSIAFTIDGEKVNKQGDIFMGFGDGEKYISFLTDFDGGVNNKEKVRGIQIYPECADGGGVLASGDVADILANTDSYHDNNEYAVRYALAGGVLGNWEKLGGSTVHNDATWPVTIEIVNDMEANEVTFRFTSDTVTRECTYSDSFADGAFVYGILPDTQDALSDNFHIHSITVTREDGAVSAAHVPVVPDTPRFGDDFENIRSRHFGPIDAMNEGALNNVTVTVTGKELLILVLVIANALTLAVLVRGCTKSRTGRRVKYEAVGVVSESEV